MDTAQIASASLLVWSCQCSRRGMPGTRSPPPFDRGTSEIVDSGVPTPGPDQNKRTFEISPTTSVGPVKEPMCNTGNSSTLREVTANDRNTLVLTPTRDSTSVSRTGSMSTRVRKVSKKSLLLGLKLLSEMFGGFFRLEGLPRNDKDEEGIDDAKK